MPPKTKPSSRQPSLLPRMPVPQMPEGYYSSGPNPNLRRFVEEHATPYDPATDDYNVKPFDKPITTTKATAIYNMHTYWSKKPHDAIREYIRHYTQPGDLVLDPFSGSGGTALAALMEGRAAVAIDLSPAATFITKNYCTPVDVDELQRAFEELQRQVKPEMHWLYETRCDRCDGRATTAYTVYSYVFQCPRCLEKTPLFDCPEVAGEKGKPIKVCPSCLARGIQEEIHTRLPRFEPVPVLVSYLCEEGCKPQRGERRHNDPHEKKREYFEKYDLAKIREIEGKPIPYWYPPHRMMNVESDTEPWGDKWRAGTSNFRKVTELFTKRNIWAIAAIANAARNSPEFSDILLFSLSSVMFGCSRMYLWTEDGQHGFISGTYYIPQNHRETNVYMQFIDKVNRVPLLQDCWTFSPPHICVSTETATNLRIMDESVDFIFTDPPYSGNYQYGELNFIWEAWLGFDTNWHDKEIVVNKTRRKTEADWAQLMLKVFRECYRVLKPGRWLSLCYHDTSEGTWAIVQDMMAEAGFTPDRSESSLFIDSIKKTFNQYTADKVTKRDLVINFRKPRPDEISGQTGLFDAADPSSFQEAARAVLAEALTAHPGSPADRLYDALVSRLVRKGQFERHDFDALLRSVAEEVNGRWYLLSTADTLDEAESSKEEAAAHRLEEFMRKALTPGPSPTGRGEENEEGVHYSDLFEQYLPVKDKPRRLLQDWLPEFFFKTSEGTWRPPQDEDERRQKAALRSSGALRRIKRFANALIEGVPPYEKDQPENPVTLADWIRQCRRAGLYEVGRALYEKGGMRFDGLDEVTQLEVEEDYQVCVGRSDSKPAAKKKAQPSIFEATDE